MTAAWSGPLPPPVVLEQFNQVVENGAERIFAAWEGETEHRHKMEEYDLRALTMEGVIGKVFAFIFVISALVLCGFCVWMNATWIAAVLGSGIIGTVVWAFVQTNRPKKP